MPDAHERVHDGQARVATVETDALLRKFGGKTGGMRSLLCAAADGFVGNEPVVAAAAFVVPIRVTPSANVRFVHVRDADGKAVNRRIAGAGEMKDVFVAIRHVAMRIDRLEM